MLLSKVEVLSEKEIRKIDETSRQILEETGIKVYSKEAIDIYRKAGSIVDYDKMIVKIPSKLVDKSLMSLPEDFKLYSR